MQKTEHNLQISGVSKTYRSKRWPWQKASEVKALQSVSFTLKTGLYGLLGPNGAGKSTLINILTNSMAQDAGSIQWDGKDIRNLGAKYRSILGYMPQQQTLYSSYTGYRFLKYLCALKEIPPSQTEKEIHRVADAVNLTDELGKRLSAYSGGMKQRLLAASAILGEPQLLIFDEPTAGLDPKERVRLRNLLKKAAQKSIVLVATHVVSDVESVADEILLLKKGILVCKAPPQTLIDDHAPGKDLEAVYLSVFGNEGDV